MSCVVLRRPVGAYVLLAIVVVAYWPSLAALHAVWTDAAMRTYTHGYLVAAVILYLLYRAYPDLETSGTHPQRWALVPLLGLSFAWLVFWRAAIQDLHLLMLPLIALCAVLAAFGWPMTRRLAFPLLFLLVALPIWSSLNGILQQLTVRAVGALIWLTGLPAYVQGDYVHVPAGMFAIESGCSGLHFFIVSLAIGALFGELGRDSLARRLMWLSLTLCLALLSNWLRVFTIVVAGYMTDMQHYLVRVDHYVFGWLVFALALLIFLWLGRRIPAEGMRSAGLPGTRSGLPVKMGAWLAAGGCATILPAAAFAADLVLAPPVSRPFHWAAGSEGWRGPDDAVDSLWVPTFTGTHQQELRTYRQRGGLQVEVFAVAYLRQKQGDEIVGGAKSLLGSGQRLRSVGEEPVASPVGAWRQMVVVDIARRESLIWFRYRVASVDFVRELPFQVWYGVNSLLKPSAATLVAIRAQCSPDCIVARQALESFPGSMLPTLRSRQQHSGKTGS